MPAIRLLNAFLGPIALCINIASIIANRNIIISIILFIGILPGTITSLMYYNRNKHF
jgi:hypothetical protein